MTTKGLKKTGHKVESRENVTEFLTIDGGINVNFHIDEKRYDAGEPPLYSSWREIPDKLKESFAEQIYDWLNNTSGEFKDFKRVEHKG